jgi:hypothetical protein
MMVSIHAGSSAYQPELIVTKKVDPKIFGQDAGKSPSASPEKPEAGRRRKTAEKESQ